jgi:hypothetical protein
VVRRLTLSLVLLTLVGCQSYRDSLQRGQRYYEENQYAQALAVWRMLEADIDSLSLNEQARYAYFRGMTDYRLARVEGASDERYNRHARYWLGLAQAIEQEHPGGLKEHEATRLKEHLDELNSIAYGTASRFEGTQSSAEEFSRKRREETLSPDAPTDDARPKRGCTQSSDCAEDHICQDGACVKL